MLVVGEAIGFIPGKPLANSNCILTLHTYMQGECP